MTQSIKEIEQEIARHKREIEELECKLEKFRLEGPEHILARELHSMLCTWNHTDGCSWFYEAERGVDDWTRFAHGEYLGKATKLIRWCGNHGVSTDAAVNLLKLFK